QVTRSRSRIRTIANPCPYTTRCRSLRQAAEGPDRQQLRGGAAVPPRQTEASGCRSEFRRKSRTTNTGSAWSPHARGDQADPVFEIGRHPSELQSRSERVCRLLLEKK